jgi:hypothetical protein
MSLTRGIHINLLKFLLVQLRIKMTTRIANFDDGTHLDFDVGKFDNFCVYIYQKDGSRRAPLDIDYFSDFQYLAEKYTKDKVWLDFLGLYEKTTRELSEKVSSYIESLCESYISDKLLFMKTFYILYASMIAENNKSNTKLGKRIKRLGLHTLIIENENLDYSVSFMRGKSWKEIDKICTSRGF